MERTAKELAARCVALDDGGQIQETPWGRWVTFADPDGTSWIGQKDNPGL